MPNQKTLLASIAAGRSWLEQHSADLLPDALVFAEVGLRAAGLSFPKRLQRPSAGRISEARIPLSPAFKTVAADAAGLYFAYCRRPPFADETSGAANRDSVGPPCKQYTNPIDRATINAALADAVRGHLSSRSRRWMHRRNNTGFVLTHQLLAWLFCVWNGSRDDASKRARWLARRVFWEATHVRGYHDLLAQQTAFLALGGWPTAGLEPLVRRVLRSQDSYDGGWHYFERRLSAASETLIRVCDGRSPLLGWPPSFDEEFGILVNVVHRAHRGHATALSICALGVFTARRTRDSTP